MKQKRPRLRLVASTPSSSSSSSSVPGDPLSVILAKLDKMEVRISRVESDRQAPTPALAEDVEKVASYRGARATNPVRKSSLSVKDQLRG